MEGHGTKSETMLPATITKTKGVCTLCVLILLGRSVFFPLECIQAFSPRQKSGLSKYNPRFAAQEREKGLEESSLPICYDPTFVRYRCRIAYDGTSFSGFQLQGGRETPNKNNPRTIQGELERVLSTRFQRVVKVVGAGRTDGGVHARGQAIHFDLYPNETSSSHHEFETDLERTMNRMLPSDIRAWRVGRTIPSPVLDVSPQGIYNWNAMRTSVSKLYSYRICVGDAMDPSERHHRWQLPWRGIDPRKLERVLAAFEGEHDFVCFAGALEQRQKKTGIAMGTVRTIHKVRLVRESSSSTRNNYGNNMGGDLSQDYYRIDIYLDGALYKMVRNIVGTAIDVCRDWMEEDRLLDLLNRPGDLNLTRKDNPCMPAPPNGLTLERVFYPDDEQF